VEASQQGEEYVEVSVYNNSATAFPPVVCPEFCSRDPSQPDRAQLPHRRVAATLRWRMMPRCSFCTPCIWLKAWLLSSKSWACHSSLDATVLVVSLWGARDPSTTRSTRPRRVAVSTTRARQILGQWLLRSRSLVSLANQEKGVLAQTVRIW